MKKQGTSKNHPSAALSTKPQSSRTSMYAPVEILWTPCIWAIFRGSQHRCHKVIVLAIMTLTLFFILIADSALAKSSKDFLRGPYFLASGGIQNFTADNNARTGEQAGRNFEPFAGFHFGWNIYDQFAPEFQARYSTNKIGSNREHIVTFNLNAVYTAPIKKSIIPFLQAGPAVQFGAIPGDPLSTDQIIPVWNPGVSVGGGIRFLFKTYLYVGILVQTDFISFSSKSQDISGTETKILNGGWKIEPAIEGNIGVHF